MTGEIRVPVDDDDHDALLVSAVNTGVVSVILRSANRTVSQHSTESVWMSLDQAKALRKALKRVAGDVTA